MLKSRHNVLQVKQLKDWLRSWEASFLHPEGKGMKGKKRGAGSTNEKKAVLLSGTPGIGKTTTARLVCEELGFNTLEVCSLSELGCVTIKVTLQLAVSGILASVSVMRLRNKQTTQYRLTGVPTFLQMYFLKPAG